MEKAIQKGSDPNMIWKEAKLNGQQLTSASNLVVKVADVSIFYDVIIDSPPQLQSYTCKQLMDWCSAKASELQQIAAKRAKTKIANEKRTKKL